MTFFNSMLVKGSDQTKVSARYFIGVNHVMPALCGCFVSCYLNLPN